MNTINTESTDTTIADPKAPVKVLYADCLRYLAAHGVKAQCPACGHAKSSVHVDPKTTEVTARILTNTDVCEDGSLTPQKSGMAIFTTSCNNCGHLRHFPFYRLIQWLKKNPEAEVSSDE